MRILAVNWRDIENPEAGGAEIHLHKILNRLAYKGYEIILVSSKYKGCKNREIIDRIKVIRIGNKYIFNLAFFWYYITKLRNDDFDIIIDDISKIPLCIPFFIRKSKVVAIVHHIHGKTLFRELPLLVAFCIYIAEKVLIPIFYRKSMVITVSESTRDELFRMGINPKNIRVIHNGIDNGYTGGEKSKKPVIIYFGRVKRYKRLDHLLRAFKIVKEVVPEVDLIIAGKGDNYKELITQSKKLGISDSVKFLREVSEEDKIKLLQTAWVFVTTSEKEGWGITVIESNACGTPVIAYNVPGLRDSIKHGYNGLLVEDGNNKALAEAIINALNDKELRKELSRNAIEWAKKFSWDKSTIEFEKVVRNGLE